MPVRKDLLSSKLIIARENVEDETVSVARTGMKLRDVPASVHVITREEIVRDGYITLVDVMRKLPGVWVSQPGSGENGQTFMVRGLLGNSRMKILINNQPIRPELLTALPIESQLPIRQAERIEVVYGPMSSLYGPDAVAGVINIITRKSYNKIFAVADAIMEADGFSYVNFLAGGKAGRNKNILDYSFFGSKSDAPHLDIFRDKRNYHPLSYLEIKNTPVGSLGRFTEISEDILKGQNLSKDTFLNSSYKGTIDMPETSDVPTSSQLIGLSLKYRRLSLTYMNMVRSTHSSIGHTPYFYRYNDPAAVIADRQNRVSLGFDYYFKKLFYQARATYLDYEMKPESNYAVNYIPHFRKAYVYSRSRELNLDQSLSYSFKNLEIIGNFGAASSANLPQTNYTANPYDRNRPLGVTLFGKKTEKADTVEFGRNPYSAYRLNASLQICYRWKGLNFLGSARYDFTQLYGNYPSFRGGVSYGFANKETAIRLTGGTAFRAPSGNLKYYSLAYKTGALSDSMFYALIPNKDLAPEKHMGVEAGVRHTFFRKLYVDLAGFYNVTSNLITPHKVNPGDYGYTTSDIENDTRMFMNDSKANSVLYGVEFTGKYNDIFPKYNTFLEVGFVYAKGHENLSGNGGKINYYRQVPEFMSKFKLSSQPFKRFYFMLYGEWASARQRQFLPEKDYYLYKDIPKINSYFVLDFSTTFLISKNLSIYVKVKNITDADYAGIDATGSEIDLRYNPQPEINFRAGMTFTFN